MIEIETISIGSNITVPSLSEDIWGPKRSSLLIVLPITIIYIIIFTFGFLGNIITCIVVVRHKYMHTVTNYYLLSLSVSDLLLLITGLPFEMYQMWYRYPYIFGDVVCVVQGLAAETSANATVLTITAFTIERYFAICYPFFSHTAAKLRRTIRYVILIWVFSSLFALIQAMQIGIVYGKNEQEVIIDELCICAVKNDFIPYSFEISLLLFFVAPMSIITVLYILIGIKLYKPNITSSTKKIPVIISTPTGDSNHQHVMRPDPSSYVTHSKSTKRVVKMLVAVVVAFFICWAPFQTQRIFAIYGYTGKHTSKTMLIIYEVVTYISGVLYYFSTVINPILYNIMSNKFRRAFHDTITTHFQKSDTNQRRNSGEIGSSGVHRLNVETSKPNNTLCTKSNSYYVRNPTIKMIADLTQRPVIISFRKCENRSFSHNRSQYNLNKSFIDFDDHKIGLSRNPHSGSLPGIYFSKDKASGMILHPTCTCSRVQKSRTFYPTNNTFYSE